MCGLESQIANRKSQIAEVGLVALLALAAGAISLTGNFGSEFWWNDAARHAMDGVFIHDAVRDLPRSLSLYQYAMEYYARYPCLGLVQYPPVFPLVEAAFFGVLGVSLGAARLAVAAFAALGAVFGYLVGRRFLGRWGAAVFVLLFFTAPGVVYWSRDVMLETPVMAMMLVASHFFLGYVEEERRGHGVAAAVLLALAILTKQTAGCLVPAWVAYTVHRRGWGLLWRRESVLGMGIAAALLVPFGVLTVWFSPVNLGQTVGGLSAGVVESRLSLASVAYYLKWLPSQVGVAGLAALALGLVGAAFCWRTARGPGPSGGEGARAGSFSRAALYGLLWALSCYALLTFVVVHKEARFNLIWAPGLALVGAAGLGWLAERGRAGRAVAAAATLALGAQGVACVAGLRHDPFAVPAPLVRGTDAAARLLAGSPRGTVVFYSGSYNGNFIFLMRALDGAGNVVVLRDSKVLYSVATIRAFGAKVYAATQGDILRTLRDYGVRYLAVEDPTPELDAFAAVTRELRALVGTERFRLIAELPLAACGLRVPRKLSVYEFLDAGPARAEVLTLELLTCGRVLRVPLSRLGVATAPAAANHRGGGD